jgi:hypothetical protein
MWAHAGSCGSLGALTTWAPIRFFSCICPTVAVTLWIFTISLFTCQYFTRYGCKSEKIMELYTGGKQKSILIEKMIMH